MAASSPNALNQIPRITMLGGRGRSDLDKENEPAGGRKGVGYDFMKYRCKITFYRSEVPLKKKKITLD